MVELAEFLATPGSSATDASPVPRARHRRIAPLTSIAGDQWVALAHQAVEPNAYHLPDWEMAVNATAPGRTDVSALSAWADAPDVQATRPRLTGLLPVVSLWRAYRLPLPALASADPYGTLCTPLLDQNCAHDAVAQLIEHARHTGARALVLRDMSLCGPAMLAMTDVLATQGIAPRVLHAGVRAMLDATGDAEALLCDALGTKKLKELRRQRRRLAEHGKISFDIVRTPKEVAAAIEVFLDLEASGWKGQRGTALKQTAGDATFIRRATVALAERGQCEIVTLRAGDTAVAAAVVPRHQNRAWFFKIGINETFSKLSPGVQLTLDLTRHLCADPAIMSADSTAAFDHPMINPIWRGRLAIGDVLIPLKPRDPIVSVIETALRARRQSRNALRQFAGAIRIRARA